MTEPEDLQRLYAGEKPGIFRTRRKAVLFALIVSIPFWIGVAAELWKGLLR
jgi:hypothetical protein